MTGCSWRPSTKLPHLIGQFPRQSPPELPPFIRFSVLSRGWTESDPERPMIGETLRQLPSGVCDWLPTEQ
ncbi:hypothetical protein CRENBAI_014248, partial [Crenichthys baileyi]